MKFRIVKDQHGYFIERKIAKWTLFGIHERWETYIYQFPYFVPKYYSSYKLAMDGLLFRVESITEIGDFIRMLNK